MLIVFPAVSLAKILFPREAKVAMDIAQVDRTSPLHSISNSKLTPGNESVPMDLNDAPFRLKEEHLARLNALSRTGTFSFIFLHFFSSYVFLAMTQVAQCGVCIVYECFQLLAT